MMKAISYGTTTCDVQDKPYSSNSMSPVESSLHELKNNGIQSQVSGVLLERRNLDAQLAKRNFKSSDNLNHIEDLEAMELYSRAKAQEAEILSLREQIAVACVKELQLLNEKCKLERKFSELRMAIDERQNEVITSASNELARRKGDLEQNLKLTTDLKAAEDERYIFMSSMLGLLAEYSLWPRVMNASSISNSIKHLHDQLQWRIRSSHDRIREISSVLQSYGENGIRVESPTSGNWISHMYNPSTIQHNFPQHNVIRNEPHAQLMSNMAGYIHYDVLWMLGSMVTSEADEFILYAVGLFNLMSLVYNLKGTMCWKMSLTTAETQALTTINLNAI